MENIQNLLQEQLKKLPFKLLENHIATKLRNLEISKPIETASKLLEHIQSGNSEPFVVDDDRPDDHITISITDEDFEGIEAELKKFHREKLPQLIQEMAEESATRILASLRKNWLLQHAHEEGAASLFRMNLEERWSRGLNHLRMLLSICREIGAENVRRHNRSKRRKKGLLSAVLIRLHGRACQVGAEIIALMENGFADGAMARWRTLHEIETIATVIKELGEETAQRYVDHQFVEAKAAMDDYTRSHAELGYQPLPKQTTTKILKDYNNALEKYGKEFASPYGWAAKALRKKKPIFPDLEAAAGRAQMRSHYRMASYNIHASARGIFFKLGSVEPSEIVAGATNAGLSEPGQNTAISLTLITSLILGPQWKFEDIVSLLVISKIRDEIPRALISAEQKLQRDDTRYRKAKSERARKARTRRANRKYPTTTSST